MEALHDLPLTEASERMQKAIMELHAAEKRLMLYAWHLREFIPQSARRATDPTVGRTYR